VKLLVSFVPPVSGLATLHLVVQMAEDVIRTAGLLLADAAEPGELEPVDAVVLDVLRENPHANWKVVRDRVGLSDANAKRALTAARRTLRERGQLPEAAADVRAVHANGRTG
jgi:hypothetical protein